MADIFEKIRSRRDPEKFKSRIEKEKRLDKMAPKINSILWAIQGRKMSIDQTADAMNELDALLRFDKELDLVHKCLTDLYETKFNDEKERIARIKQVLKEIENL